MLGHIDALRKISIPPTDPEAFREWLSGADALAFLLQNAAEDEFVLYATLDHSYLNTVVVDASQIDKASRKDLLAWDFNAYCGWGISYSSTPESLSIATPLHRPGSKVYKHAEQLVFVRTFDGRIGDKKYIEVLQPFTHLFKLHFLEERSAYCRIDERGDIEDAIRIVRIVRHDAQSGATFVTCRRDLLDQYLTLTNCVLARTFDFTRYRPGNFAGWSGQADPVYASEDSLHYRLILEEDYGSYLRGVQIIPSRLSRTDLLRRFDYNEEDEKREYASFVAHDFKNKIVREISTAPAATSNYFTKSDLPFETSPVFFRPEVLQKYKADSEKYRLEDRSITCRDVWGLETYDINEAGQVHTYIVYLRGLPYDEQLYWKAYNEEPKASISKRAFKTDFEGNWDSEYDPLSSLRDALHALAKRRAGWWQFRSEKAFEKVHYPVTNSVDEWANEILYLDQLLVEGLDDGWLRSAAKELGRNPKRELRPMKLAEECLIGFGFDEDLARQHMSPFYEVHNLRSKVKGHTTGEEAIAIRKQVLRERGSYPEHFRRLCAACDESVRLLTEVFAQPLPAKK